MLKHRTRPTCWPPDQPPTPSLPPPPSSIFPASLPLPHLPTPSGLSAVSPHHSRISPAFPYLHSLPHSLVQRLFLPALWHMGLLPPTGTSLLGLHTHHPPGYLAVVIIEECMQKCLVQKRSLRNVQENGFLFYCVLVA